MVDEWNETQRAILELGGQSLEWIAGKSWCRLGMKRVGLYFERRSPCPCLRMNPYGGQVASLVTGPRLKYDDVEKRGRRPAGLNP